MRSRYLSGLALSFTNSNTTIMKITAHCKPLTKRITCFLSRNIKMTSMLFLFAVLAQFGAKAQKAFPPACTITGVEKICTGAGKITINIHVSNLGGAPAAGTINLKLSTNNGSDAFVVSPGTFVYDAMNDEGHQEYIINVGSKTGGLNISSLVTNPANGLTSTCSKSVTVVKCGQ